ncbi:TetR/AcrR family transcriptional regulator [Agreia sp. COWG]|uniref:TetR/AcrR family transcriptional regulator n=1 Tax=Agreia sp. COWG TaxID=2773266 RepID=UPI0019256112|nr:TetR/AcrR family transcriptional regulator [Agreia sp. COWG]CAD5990995.1 TetR family transcriptional regulator [Agreia sp. COWG]
MTPPAFHHGNLRAVLLDEAVDMLREGGVDGLSLRELARRAGVSHGAPRSHFVDRRTLLEAVAERGFSRLADDVAAALAGGGATRALFGRVAQAYVRFAIEDAALMDLMFAAKAGSESGALPPSAVRLFQTLDEAMGPTADVGIDDPARDTFKLLFGATMQGIASLVATRRITRAQGTALVEEALDTLLESRLGARAVTRA